MRRKQFETEFGSIVYWTNEIEADRKTLVFLAGLTADHRLFTRQVKYFADRYNVIVWDAPGHCESRPFELEFTLMDKAKWVHGILEQEGVEHPILVGQSMGAYVSQAYMEAFPESAIGFVCIDSAPLQRKFYTAAELWMLENIEPVYRAFPWELLKVSGAAGCATTDYGRALMRTMMESYEKDEYSTLVGHGYGILADAVKAELPYVIPCPAILICGEKDQAGSTKNYMKRWGADLGLPIYWIMGAGHNSNSDRPDSINEIIEEFVEDIQMD